MHLYEAARQRPTTKREGIKHRAGIDAGVVAIGKNGGDKIVRRYAKVRDHEPASNIVRSERETRGGYCVTTYVDCAAIDRRIGDGQRVGFGTVVADVQNSLNVDGAGWVGAAERNLVSVRPCSVADEQAAGIEKRAAATNCQIGVAAASAG